MAPPPAAKNYQQHQPITTTLRTICESYPPSTCLRELLQNADDAGATEIEYVLDTKTYTEKPLLHSELADYHGPALLARNNSVFTEKDLFSLSSVGDSGKRFDPATTGKFGQGFNSVYHWTDGPWVFSRNFLLILDPHERWSKAYTAGGPAWDVIENKDNAEIQNHLRVFSAFNIQHGKELDQTIIRIPLRTESQASCSKIVTHDTSVYEIQQMLTRFSEDMQNGGLLFLKHIMKVIIRMDDTILSIAEILDDDFDHAKNRKALPEEFLRLYKTPSSKDFVKVSRNFESSIRFTNGTHSRTERYLIQHIFESSCGDQKLDSWARDMKLFPWVAVAAPLQRQTTDFVGKLFSTLSLHITTQQPLHIHGLFAIAPDRARLDFCEMANKWNSYMFCTCVANAWVEVLEHRNSKSVTEEGFGLWPSADITYKAEDLWTGLKHWLMDIVLRDQKAVWNSTNGSCVSLNHALFINRDEESVRYEAAWTAVGLPGVFLDQFRFESLQERAKALALVPALLTPAALRIHLRKKNNIPHHCAAEILEYCLSDAIGTTDSNTAKAICSELQGIRLWPTLNGHLSAFSILSEALLPRNRSEMQFFSSSRASITLNLDVFTPKVREFMLNRVAYTNSIARFRSLEDLVIDWPQLYPVNNGIESNAIVIPRNEAQDPLVREIWTWICHRLTKMKGDMPHSMHKLWLVPINGNRIRQLLPGKDATMILVIEETESLADILCNHIHDNTQAFAATLDFNLMDSAAVKYLKRVANTRPELRLAVQDSLRSLVDWLLAAKNGIEKLSESHIKQLLKHLAMLIRAQSSAPELLTLTEKMRQLPMYAKVFGLSPYTHWTVQRCNIDNGQTSYEIPTGLPALPDFEGISFFDLSDPDEKYVVQKLELLKTISVDVLLKHHLLPWIVKVSGKPMAATKALLVDWIMRESLTASETWKDLVSRHPLVPIPSDGEVQKYRCPKEMVDLESPHKQLYFDEEEKFPSPEFFDKHKTALRVCGISDGADSPTLPLDRATAFAKHTADDALLYKVRCLFTLPIPSSLPGNADQGIRRLKWLPAISPSGDLQMYAPSQCRESDQSYLVDLVWGTTTLFPTSGWKKVLGWRENVPRDVILLQLDRCIEKHDIAKIDLILPHFSSPDLSVLTQRPCILGAHGAYMVPHKVFSPGRALRSVSLKPYIDRVDSNFASKHSELISALGVRAEPSIQDLQNVQAAIRSSNGAQLNSAGLSSIIALLEVATQLGFDTRHLLVPDTTAVLRDLADVVYGERITTGKMAEFNFAHPALSPDLLKRLGVEKTDQRALRLEIEIEDEDEDEYVPREKLSTIICDTLRRYPIDATFNEFLANADDAGAKQIWWTVDPCEGGSFASQSLLSPELKSTQGASLMVFNDSVFTEKDFAGFKEIGQGGKGDDATTTGMFGRGALSMYHFTDTPIILSGGYYLILDPQQRLLSKNSRTFKRKVGIKIALSAARRMATDQLTPFDGMHGFDKNMDYFDGTIFRFPFRKADTETELCDKIDFKDYKETSSLLNDYLATARLSLLFLNTVKSITVSIRGKESPTWSVTASRPEGMEREVFYNVIISTSRESQKSRHDLWRIGLMDIDSSPADIPKIGKGSSKLTECGIAACIQSDQIKEPGFESKIICNNRSTHLQEAVEHKVFCKLPTTSLSELPVSFYASFAITGDRRTIPLEDRDSTATWNRWLLMEPVAEFYIDFLRDAAPRYGEDTFHLWPKALLRLPPTLSSVVAESFWNKVMDGKHRYEQLYPLLSITNARDDTEKTNLKRPMARERRILHGSTTLEKAHFDFNTPLDSAALLPLFRNMGLNVVRPPSVLEKCIKAAAKDLELLILSSGFLSRTFKEEGNCEILEQYLKGLPDEAARALFYSVFLKTLTPSIKQDDTIALDILHGCRIIPRPFLSLRLGILVLNTPGDTIYHLVANQTERKLFSFASDCMVNTHLFKPHKAHATSLDVTRDPIKDIMKAKSNIRKFEIRDIGPLLSRPDSPTRIAAENDQYDKWLIKFWEYLNSKALESSQIVTLEGLLAEAGILDQPVYKIVGTQPSKYLTPRKFAESSYVVLPDIEQHQKLCFNVNHLDCIDPDCAPDLLLDLEQNLESTESFKRFAKVLQSNGKAKTSLDKTLTFSDRETFRELLVKFLEQFRQKDSLPYYYLLRSLPVWRCVAHSETKHFRSHIAADNAKFCNHSGLFLPWVSDLEHFIDPKLVESHKDIVQKLGVKLIDVPEFWSHAERFLPRQLIDDRSKREHLQLLQYLARYGVRTSKQVVPNGIGQLCQASSLYDHGDNIFREAFASESQLRFPHHEFRSLRHWFIDNGLKARTSGNAISWDDFLQCISTVDKRWDPDLSSAIFDGPASTVAAYLEFDVADFRHWPASSWEHISRMKVFRVRRHISDQPSYRQARMQAVSEEQYHCALQDVARDSDIRICWSQYKFVENPPAAYVFNQQPNGGRPSLSKVYKHLSFLVDLRKDVGQKDIPQFLKDVQACYNYLQNDSDAAKALPDIKQASIWFNLDSTETDKIFVDQLEEALLPAHHLCFDAPFDEAFAIRTRKFLVPYEKLLAALGCIAIRQPPPPPPRVISDDAGFSLGATMNVLRNKHELVDIFFEAEGERVPGHKIVLAAVSDFCKIHFAGNWGRTTQHQQIIPFNFGLKRLSTLSTMLDFAYGVDYSSSPLLDDTDPIEIRDQLTEMLDVLECADSWQMLRLRDQVEDFLTERSNATTYRRADTVEWIKRVATTANATRLVTSCDDYIRSNPEALKRLKGDRN